MVSCRQWHKINFSNFESSLYIYPEMELKVQSQSWRIYNRTRSLIQLLRSDLKMYFYLIFISEVIRQVRDQQLKEPPNVNFHQYLVTRFLNIVDFKIDHIENFKMLRYSESECAGYLVTIRYPDSYPACSTIRPDNQKALLSGRITGYPVSGERLRYPITRLNRYPVFDTNTWVITMTSMFSWSNMNWQWEYLHKR